MPVSPQVPFRVLGSGFSGLIAAYELVRRGYQVEIYEKNSDVGGLISTLKHEEGLVETAANGVLNTFAFEEMCRELNVPLVATKKQSKKRYIFRNGYPSRWPIGFSSTFRLLWGFSKIQKPVGSQSVADWGRKNFDQEAVDYLLSPALQGIYAGDVDQMSSLLILGRFFNRLKKQKPSVRGSVSPEGGMGQLMMALKEWLLLKGVKFHFNQNLALSDLSRTLIATSASSAAELLKEILPQDSALLKKIEMLPLVRATLFYKEERSLKGFGCLFPKLEGFNSLGVLFDDSIFQRPYGATTESWILGGAQDLSIHLLTDDQLLHKISEDRMRLLKVHHRPYKWVVTRWPSALPHYTVALEGILNQLSDEAKLHLVGNYLGKIGLSQIIEQTQNQVQLFLEGHT